MRDKRTLYVVGDIVASLIACSAAIILVNKGNLQQIPTATHKIAIVTIIVICISLLMNAYNSVWNFAGFREAIIQLKIVCLTWFIILVIDKTGTMNLDMYMVTIYVGVLFGLTGIIRMSSRYSRWKYISKKSIKENYKRTMIIGAGEAGAIAVKSLIYVDSGLKPVAILDDDKYQQGKMLSGTKVVGMIQDLEQSIKDYKIEEIIVAIPSAEKSRILEICERTLSQGISPKVFSNPTDVKEFAKGNKTVLKEVSIEELLSRDTIKTDMTKVESFLQNKTVLITGGVGSIGSELCKQALEYNCKRLIIVDLNENGIFELNEELKGKYSNYKIYLASIRDLKRITNIIQDEQPDLVVHAAAHKHVPIVNQNPFEAIKNNYVGTRNVIEACVKAKVNKFVLISTDKAVRPTNVMGATKRMAELLVQVYNGQNGCQMSAVRFGNVLGSAGSVIPLFKKQIAEGGPITVTDKRMMRYFMTIPEAVSLVLTAGAMAQGGELFVLNMGEPVSIYEVAKKMIILSGLQPEKDIKIKEVGIRSGEKLYEELTIEGENIEPTEDNKIYKVTSREIERAWIQEEFDEILKLALEEKNEESLIKEINKFIQHDNQVNENK